MTSYGTYSRANYGAQGGEDGGGFLGGSQQGSQSGGSGKVEETLRPVTIKQLLDCEEAYPGAELTIDNANLQHTQLTIVGQVRSVNAQQTNVTYRIDDGSGQIDVKKWVDAEKQDDDAPSFELDRYVRVLGRLKTFNGRKHLGAHFIRAIDDYNEVLYHGFETTYVHLYSTKGAPGHGGADGGGGGGEADGGDGMFVDQGAYGNSNSKVARMPAHARKMYNFLMNTAHDGNGVDINQIMNGTGLSMKDVQQAAGLMETEGIIYTTRDEQTWALLDYE